MGKHKHHYHHKSNKSKKVKKHKKFKYEEESNSDHDEQIVWSEAEQNESEPKDESKDEQNEFEPKEEPQQEESKQGKDDDQDLFEFISKTYDNNRRIKPKTDREKFKEETEKKEQDLRYSRELNSYFRDDVNKRFIDQPLNQLNKTNIGDEISKEYEDDDEDNEIISKDELNSINAKILKAEMLGNQQLANELKEKLEKFQKQHLNESKIKQVKKIIKKEQKSEDSMSVKELYLKTRNITAREETMRFITSTSKLQSVDDEYDGCGTIGKKKPKLDLLGLRFTSSETNESSDKCKWCIENKFYRHLSLKLNEDAEQNCYVIITPYRPIIENCCLIVSNDHHLNNSLDADENTWTQIRQLMRKLSSFYRKYYNCIPVFMETTFMNKKRNQNLSGRHHFIIECYPIENRFEQDVKIYFHKAINDCEQEWSINRKLIKLDKMNVTKKLPKGLAYFWVSVGPDFVGYAHVIEDEDYFDINFGMDVIAGMIEQTINQKSRKRMTENYDEQMKRLKEIKFKWQEFCSRS